MIQIIYLVHSFVNQNKEFAVVSKRQNRDGKVTRGDYVLLGKLQNGENLFSRLNLDVIQSY
jgi:hypothetical protein